MCVHLDIHAFNPSVDRTLTTTTKTETKGRTLQFNETFAFLAGGNVGASEALELQLKQTVRFCRLNLFHTPSCTVTHNTNTYI